MEFPETSKIIEVRNLTKRFKDFAAVDDISLLIEPYDDFDDALAQVNHSKYGLQAGLLTRDSGRILAAYRELEVGALIVGDTPNWRLDPMPYGGVKESGLGREGIRWAIEEMTEPRMLVIAALG